MIRTYELVFIADPRLSDDELSALSEDYKGMIASAGGTITKEESWGRRKLAYPIHKLSEGKYVLMYVESEGTNPMLEVEQRMRQNDKILRYLTVRTDEDLKRAETRRSRRKPRRGEGARKEEAPQRAVEEAS